MLLIRIKRWIVKSVDLLEIIGLPGGKDFPASDLSEQISTAGTEASEQGNMKFMVMGLNGRHLGWRQCRNGANAGRGEYLYFWLKHRSGTLKNRGYNPGHIERNDVLREIFKLMGRIFWAAYSRVVFPIIESLTQADRFSLRWFWELLPIQDQISTAY